MFERIITKQPNTLSSSAFQCVTSLLGCDKDNLPAYAIRCVNAWHAVLSPHAETFLPGVRLLRQFCGYYVTGGVFRRYSVPFITVFRCFAQEKSRV